MSTTETVRAWATTNAGNAAADAAISSSDAQSPDTIDNNIRSVMAAVKKQMNDIGGSLVAGGTANALTVTTGQVLESGQITDGLRLLLKATADNTSTTVTFAPDGLTAANIKRADGSALAVGSIKSGMYLDLVYNSGSSEWRCASIAPLQPIASVVTVLPISPGLVLLTSGSVSAAATLDLVLTSYTAYRAIKIYLTSIIPANDGVALWMRFSTDGGSSYDASGYNYAWVEATDTGSFTGGSSGSSNQIVLNAGPGNQATEGTDLEITLQGQTITTRWGRVMFNCYTIDANATPMGRFSSGGGAREAAQDTDAVRFLFSVGNIASGSYAVYGLA